MGILMQNDSLVGGIDSSLVNKIGTVPLDTVAQDLSGAVNELKATGGGGNVDDVYVNGVSVLDSNKIAQIDLTGKVNTTGDTMTGNLIIENATAGAVQITNPNTDLREADNNVSSAQFNQFRIVDDGSHMTMGYFGTTVYPEGLVQGTLQVSNFDTNGDPVSNGISLTVDKDGSKSYSVSDEAAFRRAIGVVNRAAANAGADLSLVTTGDKYNWNNKVNKAGDTMTGSLTISNSSLGSYILKDNSYTINTSSNNGVSSFSGNNFEIQDSASTVSTKFGNYLSSDGSVKAIISAHNKKTDGTATSNSLEIKIAKDGTRSYAVSDPAAFRSAIGAGTSSTNTTYTIGTSGNNITLTPSGGSAQSITAPFATVADRLSGFSSRSTSMGWGNQTGSVITCFSTSNGGGWGFRDNNPSSGQTSMVLDGTIYVMEGQKQVAHAGNVSTGDSNGQVKIAGVNVSVKGLGSAAYSNTSAFAAASHSHSNYQTTLSSTSKNTGGGGTSIRKYGNVCWMPLFNCAANKVGTIPSGYRPGAMCRALLLCIVSSKVYYCIGEVSTAGAFKCWYYPAYPGSNSTEIQGTANTLYGEMIWIT